jgi:hypothetical protein
MESPLVLEMEAAYKIPSNSSTESNRHVSEIIVMRFPKGRKATDALNEIQQNGFTIYENKRRGSRPWHSKDKLKPYAVKEVRERIYKDYTDNQTNYYASLSYWSSLVERKTFTILIESHDGVITKSSAAIYSQTL